MSSMADPVHFLPLIMPVVVARLGTPDITETSEEVRYVVPLVLLPILPL